MCWFQKFSVLVVSGQDFRNLLYSADDSGKMVGVLEEMKLKAGCGGEMKWENDSKTECSEFLKTFSGYRKHGKMMIKTYAFIPSSKMYDIAKFYRINVIFFEKIQNCAIKHYNLP